MRIPENSQSSASNRTVSFDSLVGGDDRTGGRNVITGTRGRDTLAGTSGNDVINGGRGGDQISTGTGNDVIRGGRGSDTITVDGGGNKRIFGGLGQDTVVIQGAESDFSVRTRTDGAVVYIADDGSRIVTRNVETVQFTELPGGDNSGFVVLVSLGSNSIGATSLSIEGDTAVLSGPGTDFTFTGIDSSAASSGGPVTATGGSGTINGEQTTAVALPGAGGSVLLAGAGFSPTSGDQSITAVFANGDTLNADVDAFARP